MFSVGESIGILYNVTLNGLVQDKNIDYYHISSTSKITFVQAPYEGDTITIRYSRGKNNVFIDSYGKPVYVANENFIYDGSSLTFTLINGISDIITLDINGLVEEEGSGYDITGVKQVTLLYPPVVGSRVGITYLH